VDILLFGVYVSLVYGISVVFSFVAAPLYVRIRDVNQIWEVVLQLLFYGSPIIYPMSMVPERIQTFLYINPMTLLIEHARVALIDRGIARIDHLLIFIAIFLPCLAGSMIFLRRSSKNLVEKM
jgi:ABC-type polysaccharide/polyol phosphate export permease